MKTLSITLCSLLCCLVIVYTAAGRTAFAGPVLPVENETAAGDERLGKQLFIKPGVYWVGSDDSDDNKPLRQMEFKGFYIDVHPVTNGQYAAFLAASGYQPKGAFDMEQAKTSPLLPVGGVVYEDAEAYAAFYKKRLPTEWEWEIAARSLKKENLYVFPGQPHHKSGHFLFNKKYYKLPVFSYPANELGMYGMTGNVFEWTSGDYEASFLDGKHAGGRVLKVLRGGSWSNKAFDIRTFTRTPFPADRSLPWLGFRCARGLF